MEGEVQRLVEQTQKYALLYNQNKQALDSLVAFEERLEKRQNEIAEMQRLTEERLLRQWRSGRRPLPVTGRSDGHRRGPLAPPGPG